MGIAKSANGNKVSLEYPKHVCIPSLQTLGMNGKIAPWQFEDKDKNRYFCYFGSCRRTIIVDCGIISLVYPEESMT